ncbi:hypothetical protein HPP92_010647 [Vanilla planifolia]|uniref:Uncharacterized protein n=1 Tax=Vanilla planifolia TaxID=51239 RepID=A0A835R2S7_VANPL|nr:hypothetical protein HPP92_010647 [Vanilla planifolia]
MSDKKESENSGAHVVRYSILARRACCSIEPLVCNKDGSKQHLLLDELTKKAGIQLGKPVSKWRPGLGGLAFNAQIHLATARDNESS